MVYEKEFADVIESELEDEPMVEVPSGWDLCEFLCGVIAGTSAGVTLLNVACACEGFEFFSWMEAYVLVLALVGALSVTCMARYVGAIQTNGPVGMSDGLIASFAGMGLFALCCFHANVCFLIVVAACLALDGKRFYEREHAVELSVERVFCLTSGTHTMARQLVRAGLTGYLYVALLALFQSL